MLRGSRRLAPFIGQRALAALVLAVGAIVVNFLLIHLAPGDPALVLAGEAGGTSAAILAQIRHEFGLDRPLGVQLLVYAEQLARGRFGFSYYYNTPVLALILQRIPQTLLLIFTALALAGAVGVASGVLVARRPTSLASSAVAVVSLFGYAMPAFWTAIMLLLLFAVKLPWFPSHGMETVGLEGGPLVHAADVAHHLVLPAATLAIIYVALYSRLTRAAMLEVLTADFIRTARSKGLSERQVLVTHALRNALLPVITIAGVQLGQVLAGAVLVETVFSWPGMGLLAYDAVLQRDYPLLLGILFFSSLVVIVFNLLTDLSYGFLDPRIVYR